MPDPADDAGQPRLPRFDVANAQFVTDRLAVGGDLSPRFNRAERQVDELRRNGITHIIDLRIEFSDEDLVKLYAPGIDYLWFPVDDAGQRIPAAWFEDLVTWSLAALERPDAKVFVHCHMGINRSPSAVLAILLAQGWDVADALTAIRSVRPIAAIDYAGDVLSWHLARTRANPRVRGAAVQALKDWRRANRLDVQDVIRLTRSNEDPLSAWFVRQSGTAAEGLLASFCQDPDEVVLQPIGRRPDELARGDVVFLWRTDPPEQAGIFGIGRVDGPPRPLPVDSPARRDAPRDDVLPLLVILLGLRVPASALQGEGFGDSDLFPARTPDPVRLTPEQLAALDRVLGPLLAAAEG